MEIAGTDDMPSFGGVIPRIDDAEHQKMMGILGQLELSYAVLAQSVKDATDAKDALLSWAALAEKVVTMVMPLVNKYLEQSNVPAAEHPHKGQLALQGLLGAAILPPAQRPNAIAGVLEGLLG